MLAPNRTWVLGHRLPVGNTERKVLCFLSAAVVEPLRMRLLMGIIVGSVFTKL